MKPWLRRTIAITGVTFGMIQLVPYGRDHENPPVRAEPPWDTPRTRELAARACFDCHSHETRWPWYSQVAPMSWLVQHDVDEGRGHLNFSVWDVPQDHADDAAEEVEERTMPPSNYLLAHPEAKLTDAERAELARGLAETLDAEGDSGGRRRRRGGR